MIMIRLPILCRRSVRLLPIMAILAVTTPGPGPEAGPIGVPDDWSHRHVVFSNPGTAAEAVRNGTYTQWVRTVTDPRYLLQQQKRAASARAGVAPSLTSSEPAAQALTEQTEPAEDAAPQADFSVQQMKRGTSAQGEALNSGQNKLPIPPRRRVRPHMLQTDWSEDLGSGAALGLSVYPAKFSFSLNTAKCDSDPTPDYVVYNTSLAGAPGPGGQASIVAYDNLYSGCSGAAPMVYWAYDTNGGTISTSVILSYADGGKQLAFVQSTGGVASLVVLKWKVNHADTVVNPEVLANTAPGSYRACTAPCMTAIAFSNSANDTGSAPFFDYQPGHDLLYVGDDAGALHKFTGVFAGTPAEAPSPWPVSVSAHANALASPVLDSNTGDVLVGDYQGISEPNCGLGCGFLYRVSASTGTVVQSGRLDFNAGIVDAPLLDLTAGMVYLFVGADSNVNSAASPCGAFQSCSGVIQLSAGFLAGATGTEETLELGNDGMYAGTFDNAYFTSANHASPTGHLYVLGHTGGDIKLYQIPVNSNVMGAPVTGPVISTNFTNGFTSRAMPVTEIFNGVHDFIFTSALLFGAPAACAPASFANGCVMGFDVSSGVISGATTPTGATSEAGGVSGIIIDNFASVPAGTSNIYYTTLADQPCPTSGGSGGCAIQISQSSP